MDPNTQPPNTAPTEGENLTERGFAVSTTKLTSPENSVSRDVTGNGSTATTGVHTSQPTQGQKAEKAELGETAFPPCETKPAQAETTKPENEKGRKSARETEKTAAGKPTDPTGSYARYMARMERAKLEPPSPQVSIGDPDSAIDVVREVGQLAFIRTSAGNIPGGGKKLTAKTKCLELLMKYHGLIIERTQRVPADVREARELLLEEAKRAGLRIEPGPRPALLTAWHTGHNQPSRKPKRQVVDVTAEPEDDPA